MLHTCTQNIIWSLHLAVLVKNRNKIPHTLCKTILMGIKLVKEEENIWNPAVRCQVSGVRCDLLCLYAEVYPVHANVEHVEREPGGEEDDADGHHQDVGPSPPRHLARVPAGSQHTSNQPVIVCSFHLAEESAEGFWPTRLWQTLHGIIQGLELKVTFILEVLVFTAVQCLQTTS